jgi:hypothetical protein
VGEVTALKMEKAPPAGTFRVEKGQAIITYDPTMLGDPMALVATFAHELCHYRIAAAGELPPGGQETLEFATDLAAVFLGFGIFGANCAFRFQQRGDSFSQGWQWSRHGYLQPRTWCYALAVFFVSRGEPVEAARPFLKPHLFSDLADAAAYLRRRPERLP